MQLTFDVAAGREQADRLVKVLAAADPEASCWTWAVTQQNAGFVLRHQVQEAAVHHWDAMNVEEFLTFSVSTDAANYGAESPPLASTFALHATDTDRTWTVSDGAAPPRTAP